jgi:hypothetical protein
MGEEKRKVKHIEPGNLSSIAFMYGITTFLLGLLIVTYKCLTSAKMAQVRDFD